MSVHCRPWDGISHVVTSGGSYWYEKWCDGDRDQLITTLYNITVLLCILRCWRVFHLRSANMAVTLLVLL